MPDKDAELSRLRAEVETIKTAESISRRESIEAHDKLKDLRSELERLTKEKTDLKDEIAQHDLWREEAERQIKELKRQLDAREKGSR